MPDDLLALSGFHPARRAGPPTAARLTEIGAARARDNKPIDSRAAQRETDAGRAPLNKRRNKEAG